MKRTKQTFWRALAIATALLTMPAAMWADSAFGGGSGTEFDPYIIETPQHLRQLAADVNDGNSYDGKYFKMISSFSCWIEPFTPIGGKYYTTGSGSDTSTGTRKFCGDFNGNGMTINDLNIRPTEGFYGIGLFGELGYGARVHDLTIASWQITTTIMGWGNCGAIAGSVHRKAIIYNCHVKEGVVVSVDPDNLAQNVQNSCDFGGIAGENGGIIQQCTSMATVTNAGISGVNTLGGIVGGNYGKVWSCTYLGAVIGSDKVGGIAGDKIDAFEFSSNYYHSSPAIGAVNGASENGVSWMGTISFSGDLSGNVIATPAYSYKGVNYYAQDSRCSIGLDLRVNEGYIPVAPQLTSEQVEIDSNNSFTFPAGQDVVIGCTYSALKRDISYTPWVSIDIPSQKYSGGSLTPVITVTDNMTGSPVVLSEGVDYSVSLPTGNMVEAGDYTITINGMGNFAGTATAIFAIAPLRWLGEGTEESPYQIRTVDDMRLLADETLNNDFAGTHFILMNDLDFTSVEYKMVGHGDGNKFCGVFDGNGNTIDNVILDNTINCTGLFCRVGSGGVIKNLISGSGNTFRDRLSVGGIVGSLGSADVIGCTSYATVIAFKASTYTGRYAGGIVGSSTFGYVRDCRNYGSVTADSRFAGGIIGLAQNGSTTSCLNFAQVSAGENVGGIIGTHDYVSISNNYYAGDCTVGGINGSDVEGQAMRGYTITGIGAVNVALADGAAVGVAHEGLVYAGYNQQAVIRLAAGQGSSSPIVGYQVSAGTLVDNGDGTWTLTMPSENVMISGNSLGDFLQGEGTASAPYLIASVEDMTALAQMCQYADFTGVHFRLTANLDYTGAAYVPVGSTAHPFNGTFDGYFRTISNVALTCDDDSQGLFGCIGSAGSVSSLYLSASSINGNGHNSIGAIAGTNGGTITMCHVLEDVDVRGGTSVGCAAGEMTGGEISYCELAATVVGTGNVGGIVGYSHSAAGCSIIENLMDGRVGTSGGYAGGIVGRNEGSMELMGCYNSATVKSVVGAGGIVGCDDGGTVSDCMNFAAVICDDAAGGIAGTATAQSTLVNNYYHGQCEAGGINGADVTGQAMRGYIVSSDESEVFFQMFPDDEGNFVGITYDGIFYLGAGETSKLLIDRAEGAPDGPFVVSAGTLTPLDEEYDDRTDLFYLLTMPTPGQDVTISIMGALMGDLDGNGVLEVNDVVILAELAMSGGATAEQISIGDLDGSGTIDVNDVVILSGMVMGS